LLRGFDHDGITIEVAQECLIALHFANHAPHEISGNVKLRDLHAVERLEVSLSQTRCRDRDLMSAGHHAFGDLTHYLLNAATAGVIELTTEKQPHNAIIGTRLQIAARKQTHDGSSIRASPRQQAEMRILARAETGSTRNWQKRLQPTRKLPGVHEMVTRIDESAAPLRAARSPGVDGQDGIDRPFQDSDDTADFRPLETRSCAVSRQAAA
jgi:hypothetical protein